jgi:hypothetical protein
MRNSSTDLIRGGAGAGQPTRGKSVSRRRRGRQHALVRAGARVREPGRVRYRSCRNRRICQIEVTRVILI